MHIRGKMPSRVRHPYRRVCVLRQRDVREVLRKVLEELGREDKGDVRLVEARADEKAFAALDVLVGRRQPLRGQLEVAERGVADALVLELEVEAALVLRGVRRAERIPTACAAASFSSAPRSCCCTKAYTRRDRRQCQCSSYVLLGPATRRRSSRWRRSSACCRPAPPSSGSAGACTRGSSTAPSQSRRADSRCPAARRGGKACSGFSEASRGERRRELHLTYLPEPSVSMPCDLKYSGMESQSAPTPSSRK